MALRSLFTEIGLRDSASAGLEGIDTSIDGIRDGLEGTQDDISGLTHDTGEFGYQASKDIGEVTGKTGELEEETRSFGDRMRSVGDTVIQHWKGITAGVSAAGLALEGFARSQQDMIESSERLAYATELEAEEFRGMAVDMANATFDLKDVYALMDLGRKQGLKSEDQLRSYANYWDMVADASGESSVALAEAGIGLRAVGIKAGQEEDALASFGFVHQETTSRIMDFLYMLERSGPELREMGMDINDTAAMLGLMEHELGMSGRMARMEFRQAVNTAEGDLGKLLDTLGLSESQFNEYRGAVDGSAGVIKDLAVIYYENRTAAQHLQAEVANLMHLYGAEFMPIIEMLSPLFTGAAVVMGTLAAAQYIGAGAALTTAGAFLAMGVTVAGVTAPLWIWIAAILAVSAAATYLWNNWDEIISWITGTDLYQSGKDIILGLAGGIKSGIDWVGDAIAGVADTIVGGIKSFFGISSPSELMWEFGVNMGEGLHLGLEDESKGFFDDARRMFTPEREQRMAPAAAGAYSPNISIVVNGAGKDAESIATAIDRRLRQTFSGHADRYFARQRRRK